MIAAVCVHCTKKQYEEIMAPAMFQALPTMGICRYYHSVVYGPLSRMGLGIPHIHSMQEISKLKDMMHHSALGTFTGQLYCGSLEAMILEVGVGTDILQYNYNDLQHLAKPLLIKSTWETLSENNLKRTHDISIPLPRADDTPLMQLFYHNGARGPVLLTLNYCRLFLKAFHLSDITDFSGTHITDSAWQGNPSSIPTNSFSWPKQGKPSTSAWCTWRGFLSQHVMARHRMLRRPLGLWLNVGNRKWFFNPEDERLYENRGINWWYYDRVPLQTRRLVFVQGGEASQSKVLHEAYVTQSGQWWVCSSHGVMAAQIPVFQSRCGKYFVFGGEKSRSAWSLSMEC